MSKIEEFKSLKAELESLKAIQSVDIEQVNFAQTGGLQSQFIVSGMQPQDVGVLVKYIKDKWLTGILTAIKVEKKVALEAARIAAAAEANQFVADNAAVVV